MGDKQVRQPELPLEILQHIDHLGLNGHVQGGDGLVADDELGIDRQGAGDADALALAAGELVGVAVGVLPHQAHVVQQFIDPLAPLLLGGEFGVKIQRLPDDVHDRHTGV